MRLTPKNWKEIYEEYAKNGGVFCEFWTSPEVDDRLIKLCVLEDKIENGELVEK